MHVALLKRSCSKTHVVAVKLIRLHMFFVSNYWCFPSRRGTGFLFVSVQYILDCHSNSLLPRAMLTVFC